VFENFETVVHSFLSMLLMFITKG